MFENDTLSLSSLPDKSVKKFSVIALLVGRSVMVIPRIGHPDFQNLSFYIVIWGAKKNTKCCYPSHFGCCYLWKKQF